MAPLDFTHLTLLLHVWCRVHHRTGVEMEALTGAASAALCVYDMCKATSHEILIKVRQYHLFYTHMIDDHMIFCF